jgi:hypothetical protein
MFHLDIIKNILDILEINLRESDEMFREVMFDNESKERRPVKPQSLDQLLSSMGILSNSTGGGFNLFPSDKKGPCRPDAIFLSFTSKKVEKILRKGHRVPVDQIMKKMTQQVLGSCFDKNKSITLLTDNIDTIKCEEWLPNLKVMRLICDEFQIVHVSPRGELKVINDLFDL